jgi:hypothetical protein
VSNEATLLTNGEVSSEQENVSKVLRFLGIPVRVLTVAQFWAQGALAARTSDFRLICDADVFLRLLEGPGVAAIETDEWEKLTHSAFVYSGQDARTLGKLACLLTGDRDSGVDAVGSHPCELVVSEEPHSFAGPLAGLTLKTAGANVKPRFALRTKGPGANVISDRHGAHFARLVYRNVPVFLSVSPTIVNLEAELPTGLFDIREHALSALPLVLYAKWAFAQVCWAAPETSACLIIDDPPLKPTYGFVNFAQLATLMQRHRFSTNIAFIPWNWRRTNAQVVQLFKQNPAFSISVHGCDHTSSEFGSPDRSQLHGKTSLALERMNRLEARTGLRHDSVMVFPQGVFSEAATRVLKSSNLIAAVNNDTISADAQPRAITIAEVWDTAVMSYGNFAIFTRRYPWDGIENFAFDVLLGKPVLIVIHHDFCSDGGQNLIEFIESINSLHCRLEWCSLEEAVSRSCRQRELSADLADVEMYGNQLWLRNHSSHAKRFAIQKREQDPSVIQTVEADSVSLDWKFCGSYIEFAVELNPGASKTIRIKFRPLDLNSSSRKRLGYRLKTMMRRYLSEARDNYVMKGPASRFFRVN